MAESDFQNLAPAHGYAQLLQQDDRTLALAVHEGQQLAAIALIDRYFDPLFNLILAATGMAATAEDTAQAAIVGRLRHLAQRPPAADEPRWLVALAASAWRLLMEMGMPPERRSRRLRINPRQWEAQRLQLSDDVKPNPQRIAQRLRYHLWQAFSRLSFRQRFILALAERHQVSVDELAYVLGVDAAEARRQRDRAKMALLRRLPGRVRRPWSHQP